MDDCIEPVATGTPPSLARGSRLPTWTIDVAFAALVAATAAWYLRLSRHHFFAYDDWSVAIRPSTLADLVRPHNGHLSVVPLLVYRLMLSAFGLRSYTPYVVVGMAFLVALVVAIYLFARRRVGGALAFLVAGAVLWMPSQSFTPFLLNLYVALLCGVVCAAALPSRSPRSDVAVGASLLVAFLTSGVGVAIAAACGIHSILDRSPVRRWLAVVLPTGSWFVWWIARGDHERGVGALAFGESVREALRGIVASFEVLAVGTALGGAALGALAIALLIARWRTDRASARTQLAWTGGLVAWWLGVVWARTAAFLSAGTRYRHVGAVLVALSFVPSRPLDRLGFLARRSTVVFAAATAAVVFLVAANHGDTRVAVRGRATNGRWAKNVLVEVERAPTPIADSRRLTAELAYITAGDYRRLTRRFGSPLDPDSRADAVLVDDFAIRVQGIDRPGTRVGRCGSTSPILLPIGATLTLRTDATPVVVSARRFGSEMIRVRRLPPHILARVTTDGASITNTPWEVSAPGACVETE